MSINFKRSFLSLLLVAIFFSLVHQTVFAGRNWVIDTDKHWNVVRVCTDGAEILVVDFLSTTYDPNGYQHGNDFWTTVEVELQAKAFLDDPQKYLDEDGNIVDEIGSTTTISDDYFYPVISSLQTISGTNSTTPISIDFNESDNIPAETYHLYGQDVLMFNQPAAVGSWVLFRWDILAQVEDCKINDYSSQENTDLNFLGPDSDHFPAGDLRYTVTQAPTNGSLQMGIYPLAQDSYFSGGAFGIDDLRFFGAGGDETIRIGVTGITRISEDNAGDFLSDSSFSPTISADGSKIAYVTAGVFDAAFDQNNVTDILLYYGNTVSTEGITLDDEDASAAANGGSWEPDITADGSRIAFASNASNLAKGCDGDTNNATDVFVFHDGFNSMSLVSMIFQGLFCSDITHIDGASSAPAIAGDFDSERTVFQTAESLAGQLVTQDNNNGDDIIGVFDFQSTAYSKRLYGFAPPGFTPLFATGDGSSTNADISADGETVVFETNATDLFSNDNNGARDIVSVKNSIPTHISVNSNEVPALGGAFEPAVSRFGNHIAFISAAKNLTVLDTNDTWQVYVRDLDATCTVPISVSGNSMGNSSSSQPSISADGRFVAFQSYSSNLADLNDGVIGQVFVMDRDADGDGNFYTDELNCVPGPSQITLVSANLLGDGGNDTSGSPEISANGEYVVFDSFASNLIPSEENARTEFQSEIYLRYLGFETEITFSEPEPEPTETPTETSTPTAMPTETSTPTAEPSGTPDPMSSPTVTPDPSVSPTPEVTPEPSQTPEPPVGALDKMIYLPMIRR